MSREQAETTLRQDIEYAWEPWLDKDTIPQSKFSRVIRNALAPNLIGQYKEAAMVLLRKFIKEDDIDEDELDELADSAMTKHSAWIAGMVTETTTKWIEDDQNPGRAFSRERAELIAITEITRARTMGEMAAAELLAEVDVILVGTWITMEDELVCEVCGPLHLTPESYWSEFFPNGSPAHVRCRCNIEWKEKAKRPSKRTKQVGRMGKRSRPKKVFSRMRRRSAEEVEGFEVITGTRLVEGGVGSGIKGHTTPKRKGTAKDWYNRRKIPKGWFVHGRAGRQDLETGRVIQMTRSWDVVDQYAGDQGSKWLLKPNDDAKVMDFNDDATLDRVVQKLKQSAEDGLLPDSLSNLSDDDVDWDKIKDELNPKNIVDSAGFFDQNDFNSWLWDNFEPTMVATNDGAVVIDLAGMKKVKVQESLQEGGVGSGITGHTTAKKSKADNIADKNNPITSASAGERISVNGVNVDKENDRIIVWGQRRMEFPDESTAWNYLSGKTKGLHFSAPVLSTTKIPIDDNAKYRGRDEPWTERPTGSEILKEPIVGWHYSSKPIKAFLPQETAFYRHWTRNNIDRPGYAVLIPAGTEVTYYDDEVRVTLTPEMQIRKLKNGWAPYKEKVEGHSSHSQDSRFKLNPNKYFSNDAQESLQEGGVGSGITGHTTPRVRQWTKKRFKNPEHAKAFEEWFGDSKVVDENGDPLVVYHGSEEVNFNQFKRSSKPTEPGIWATNNPGTADGYHSVGPAGNAGHGSGTYAIYLAMDKPLEVDWETYAKANGSPSGNKYNPSVMARLFREAKANGNDGLILRGIHDAGYFGKGVALSDNYVVFNSNQVKSATGNQGTFNPASNNINEALAPNSEENLA